MKCSIYRGKRREDHYIYLAEANNFDPIPDTIKRLMGEFVLAMEIEITLESKLANGNAEEILTQIEAQGFFLQMPPKHEVLNVKVGSYERQKS
ncbi:MAG: YcgL domain-containing protein [Gammaproteobacteria bacterium]|nr:YcgL domain-containing protein [Gammaproteobacteria bacterium]MCF6231026.1 YcgL domain-containing protein [Gammaproteobacteria bacterium]